MDNHPRFHYKYCPRCAHKGEFDSVKFAFTCLKCGFQFFLNSSAAVTAVIYNEKGELLMTRRGVEPAYGKLDFPGGFVDPNESAETAMLREIKEELDIVPHKIEYLGSFPNEYEYSGTIVFTTDMVFRCHVNDFSTLTFRDDIIGLEFIHPSKIDLNEVPFQSARNILKEICYEHRDSE
jgi:NAD+ diphosphatase